VAAEFDVIIVGAGPARIFAALELTALTSARIPASGILAGREVARRLLGAGPKRKESGS
jgi:predicted flavoprotein YhiN